MTPRRFVSIPHRTATVHLAMLALLVTLLAGPQFIPTRAPSHAVVQTHPLDGAPTTLALDTRTARVFVMTAEGRVFVLDTHDGRVLRTVPLGPTPDAVAVDAPITKVVVAAGSDTGQGSVSLLDARTGRVLTTHPVGQGPHALAVNERSQRVFVANSGDGSLSLLDARTGAALRTLSLVGPDASMPIAVGVDARTNRAFVVLVTPRPPFSGRVAMLDGTSGRLLHTVAIGAQPAALAVDTSDNRVYVANTGSDSVSLLDARQGVLLRTVPAGPAPAALAVDARRGRVYVASAVRGNLRVLDARTGAILHAAGFLLPSSTRGVGAESILSIAVDAVRGRVVVADALSNRLSVCDGSTGRLARSIAVGMQPVGVAVDERSEYAVVISAGGMQPATSPAAWWVSATQTLHAWWLPLPLAAPQKEVASVSIVDLASA